MHTSESQATMLPKNTFIQRISDRIPFLGIYFSLFSGLSFVLCKLFVKMVPNIHPVMCIFLRSLFPFILNGSLIIIQKKSFFADNRRDNLMLMLRGIFGFITTSCSFAALILIPLGDAVTILLCYAVYTNVFARIFLKEPLTKLNMLFIFFTISGVALITRPSFLFPKSDTVFDEGRFIGIGLNIIASIAFALSLIVIRVMKNTNSLLVVFHYSVYTGLGCALVLIVMKYNIENTSTIRFPNTLHEVIITLLISLCGLLGEMFMTYSLKVERAGVVAVTRGMDIIIAFASQAIFLHEEDILWTSGVGALIILVGVVGNSYVKLLNERNERKAHVVLSPPLPSIAIKH